ncbi:MAG: hypothetical protein AAFO29_14850, partial [Actinomycetota bacterium]
MIWIYLASAIFGGVFLIPMLLSGLDIGGGADLDGGEIGADLDVDIEIDGIEVDGPDGGDGALIGGDGGGGAIADIDGGPLGAVFASLLSFRTLVSFTRSAHAESFVAAPPANTD